LVTLDNVSKVVGPMPRTTKAYNIYHRPASLSYRPTVTTVM